MALSPFDRSLLDQCLARKERAWETFVDRFAGLVIHVINHTARCRSFILSQADRDDLASEVFLTIILDDFAVLRRFRGNCSLATYLTVIARRVVVRQLLSSQGTTPLNESAEASNQDALSDGNRSAQEKRIDDVEEVQRLLNHLQGSEADVVRMFHLEGKSYHEISGATGMPANSLGPLLSRARAKLRSAGASGNSSAAGR